MTGRLKKTGIGFVAALMLTACAGEPSESNLLAAVKANSSFAEIHGVKKLGCVQAKEKAGYVCDVEVDATLPVLGRHKTNMNSRFVKGDDGWRMVGN